MFQPISNASSGPTRVLVIDDDRELCALIKAYLDPLGYEVLAEHSGPAGSDRALAEKFHALILDVNMPGMDGFEVLKKVRAKSDVPILMLTSRGEETDRIVGLEMGADDYLPKTFSSRELLARLRAVTRRTARLPAPADDRAETEIVVGALRINPGSRVALLGAVPLTLTALEFDLLASLARARGRVKSRENLIETLADRHYDGLDRSIDVHIWSLRKKLGDDPKNPRFIRTVRAVGYMLINPGRCLSVHHPRAFGCRSTERFSSGFFSISSSLERPSRFFSTRSLTLNLDWFFFTGARERMEAVRDLIVGELDTTLPDEWPAVLKRYSEAHRVRFALFDEHANPLVGETSDVPAEVSDRLMQRFPPGIRPPTANPSPPVEDSDTAHAGPRPPLRALMRTTGPTQYWLMASGRVNNFLFGDPLRVVLVARSNSLSAGGLIFNPNPWLALVAGVFVFSLLFWLPLVRGITRTIDRMMHATRQIADGRFEVRVNLRRRDELGGLAESIDQMAARLDGLVTGQKRFLGDVAHELCSPLVRLQMALGVLEQHATPTQIPFVKSASEKAAQIAALIGELLSFSKAELGASAGPLEPVSLAAAAAEAVRRETTETADLRLILPEDFVVSANPELLTRALANLLRNAIQHAGGSGPISLQAENRGGQILITVTDSGPGVPDSDLPRIFDAFYRVDPSRTRATGGSGLGLAIVKSCIESCGGSVTAHSRHPHGLQVQIELKRWNQ